MRRWLLLLTALPLAGMFMMPTKVPVERLMASAQDALKRNRDDAAAHYLLGRLHSYAFARQMDAQVWEGKDQVPTLAFDSGDRPARESTLAFHARDREHAQQSIAEYREAVRLSPKTAVYHFSLAWMQTECAKVAAHLGSWPREKWLESAVEEYRAAFRLALAADKKAGQRGPGPTLSIQAGAGLLKLLAAKNTPEAEKEAAEIRQEMGAIENTPMVITPVIFSLDAEAVLSDVTSTTRVRFDLDGLGAREWTWLRPGTCLLVWDPERTGRVASGLQLFGNVTWWMFWQNGYQPLAALDDNRDGWLTGRELLGIAVWQDRNGNGISEPGEVTPASEFGIEAIAVTPLGDTLSRPGGIRLRGRGSRTTWDWNSQAVRSSKSSS